MRVLLLALVLAAARIYAQPVQLHPQEPQQYHLPPDKLQKANEYSHARNWLHFTSEFYEIAVLGVILALGWAARFLVWTEAVSCRLVIQASIFVPVLLLANDLLNLPLAVYGQHLELKFSQSIQ